MYCIFNKSENCYVDDCFQLIKCNNEDLFKELNNNDGLWRYENDARAALFNGVPYDEIKYFEIHEVEIKIQVLKKYSINMELKEIDVNEQLDEETNMKINRILNMG